MEITTIISMIVNLCFVFGGFIYFLRLAIKKEKTNK
ncbi:MAG: MetS family NSS transporter small subunit [Cyclobacteriaceae bacterium]